MNDRRGWRGSNCSGLHARSFGGSFLRCLLGSGLLLGCGFRCGDASEMLPYLFGYRGINRTRMRLFLRDAGLGQIVDDDFRLDLKFACQFVDADLIRLVHCPPELFLATLFRVFRRSWRTTRFCLPGSVLHPAGSGFLRFGRSLGLFGRDIAAASAACSSASGCSPTSSAAPSSTSTASAASVSGCRVLSSTGSTRATDN